MPARLGSWSAPVSGTSRALTTVACSGFCVDWVPGAVARAYSSFTSRSIGSPLTAASRKLPTDCACGADAAPADPPPAAATAPKARTAAVAAEAKGSQRLPRRRPEARCSPWRGSLTVIQASRSGDAVIPAHRGVVLPGSARFVFPPAGDHVADLFNDASG